MKREKRTDVRKNTLILFLTMLKIGLFTFGGGYAMIALLENEFTEKKTWLDKDEFLDMVALAESTPGPIAINSSTYIGYKVGGFLGAVVATVAVCIPSFVILYLISLFFDGFLSFKLIAYAFKGIQVCVIYLIFRAGLKLFKGMKRTPVSMTLLCAVALCMICFSLFAVSFSTIFYILICGGVGVFIYLIKRIRERREAREGREDLEGREKEDEKE